MRTYEMVTAQTVYERYFVDAASWEEARDSIKNAKSEPFGGNDDEEVIHVRQMATGKKYTI